ncbi:MAG: class II glutamine amidotransferase [Gammaproteobacteria bacterium]|nr:class II glutamine amidotransferase [Gammaproteobacteria bacterium]MBT8109598.1 class II glutamine amidotransferase [Gammaproteobacteria bacterium]NND47243.1 class II glutamine amidotransferase [Woeseiaceae bacterium]NNL44300.1 class II glutamine amidotransferase [Woeseiaceae bacterium]
MSSRYPTSVGFSLETLARRGGHDGPHKDGWGVAYFEDHDVFLLRESSPAAESGLVRFIEKNGPPSNLVLSHIRLATQGDPALRNTQPFQRELGGRAHVFAHNGNMPGIREKRRLESNRFTPVGDTDSEFAFCCLLERLGRLWDRAAGRAPSVDARLEIVVDFAAWLRPLGPFNFVYSDGDALFVHSHRRTQSDGEVRPPGLHLLARSCNEQAVDLSQSGIILAPLAQELALVASVPLTDEPWEEISEGEVVALTQGTVWARTPAAATTAA